MCYHYRKERMTSWQKQVSGRIKLMQVNYGAIGVNPVNSEADYIINSIH